MTDSNLPPPSKSSSPPPPPPYTPSVQAAFPRAQSSSGMPPIFTAPHHHAHQQGPTPPTQLPLPYAYHHQISDHSVADRRARSRFVGAVLYSVGIWVLVGMVLGSWGEAWQG